MESLQNILVTGNGFDLYHGLKTGYMDFIKCVEDAFGATKETRTPFQVELTQLCNRNGFFRHFHFGLSEDPSWTYFENEMENMIAALTRFQDVVLENQKDPEYDLVSYNIIGGLYSYNDLQIYKHFVRIFEQIYDDPSGGMFKLRQQFITPEKILNQKELIQEVRRELESFTRALELYLNTCVTGQTLIRKSRQIEAIQPDYVINFNYTHTPCAYGISPDNIFYAKGKAGSEPSDLVLGTPDETEEHMDWVYVKNYFQKLMKWIGLPRKEKLYPVKDGKPVPVVTHFFGYSFPTGDQELIRELMQISSQIVIYYTDMEDYAFKMIQLLKVFGKKGVEEQIHSGSIVFTAVE